MDIIVRELNDNGGIHTERICQYHELELNDCPVEPLGGKKDLEILFITGNKNKVIELEQHINLKHVKFSILDIDLPEIQAPEALDIVQDKCQRAYEHIQRLAAKREEDGKDRTKVSLAEAGKGGHPDGDCKQSNRFILVEDTCLNFEALNGMPGPYVKWFMKAVGPEGLHRMLADFEDKSAEAVCIYALMMEGEKRILFFRGIARGQITKPRGSSWGWDPIFEEQRSRLTFGEMDAATKSKFSHRANALTIFKKFLTTTNGQGKSNE